MHCTLRDVLKVEKNLDRARRPDQRRLQEKPGREKAGVYGSEAAPTADCRM
jgi:hypothetical protein